MKRPLTLILMLSACCGALGQKVTYYENIAPIIVEKCLPCHRDGEVAPFPLTNYEEVAAKSKLVKSVTQSRFMPPWLADNHFQQYANDRSLSQEQIDLIAKWVDGGKLEGNPANAPKMPEYQRNSLIDRKPDLTLRMRQPIFLPGDNKERFVTVKIPVELDETQYVDCIEFIPGNRKVCHHSNFTIIKPERENCMYEGRFERNSGDGYMQNTWKLFNLETKSGRAPAGFYYGGWVPGASPPVYPGDLGVFLPKKFIMLIDAMHYAGTPVDTYDYSSINIFYKKNPTKRKIAFMTVGSGRNLIEPPLYIPANTIRTFNTGTIIEKDLSVLYVMAHMHLIGVKYECIGVTPLGDTINIIKIDDWDLNWQEYYQFNPMLKLPIGTKIMVRGTYDNTVNNPNNPFNPPQDIESTGNMETTNEMLNLILLAVPYNKGDETKILD